MKLNTDTQEQTERMYSKTFLRDTIEEEIDEKIILQVMLAMQDLISKDHHESKNIRLKSIEASLEDVAISLIANTMIADSMTPIQAIIGKIEPMLGLDKLDAVKTVAEMLAVCEHLGIYELYHQTDYRNKLGTLGLKSCKSISPLIRQHIDLIQYLPPMLVSPNTWKNNHDGGHLTFNESVILGKQNHHSKYQALDVINTLQEVSFSVDEYIYGFMEEAKKPLDTHQKIEQFNQYKNESVDICEHLLENDNRFHFVWKFDKRGRMYSQGYHVNLQGTEYKKALLNFTNKELIQ